MSIEKRLIQNNALLVIYTKLYSTIYKNAKYDSIIIIILSYLAFY